jgi:TetR/AcrR family transcriptional repressor of mexJK operon
MTFSSPFGRPAGPGRPKDLAKREAILTAARGLFFSKGLDGVGIEEIARAADVSKMTVYANFGDKTAIFSAVVAAEAQRMTAALDQLPGEARDLEQRLVASGTALLTFLTSPEIVAFERLLIAEATRHPELARAMIEAGPRFGHRKLAAQIDAATRMGLLDVADPLKAAEQLTSLWRGRLHLECQLGVRKTPTVREVDQHVREGVEMFLRCYQRA